MSPRVHLLCSPFPSPQGTQGAIASMLEAEVRAGIASVLVALPESYGTTVDSMRRYRIDRLPRVGVPVGPRSGPSFARFAHDLAAIPAIPAIRARAIRRTNGERGPSAEPRSTRSSPAPEPVLAHNVEAAFVCACSGTPFVYVAHTSMRDEMPTYGHAAARACAAFGALLDHVAVTTADRVAAIAPALARDLARRHGRSVAYVPIPWNRAADVNRMEGDERIVARAALGIPPAAWVVLHAGNLDGYQGLADVRAAVHAMMPLARAQDPLAEVVLLVATCADPEPLRRAATDLAIRFAPLASEEDRRLAHAVADVVLVARTAAGGLPVKLLDAFARGVPVVATRTATAGLALDGAAIVVDDGDPRALAGAAATLVTGNERSQRIAAARDYLATSHSDDAYLDAMAIAARSRR